MGISRVASEIQIYSTVHSHSLVETPMLSSTRELYAQLAEITSVP